jgi:hypothetical protein
MFLPERWPFYSASVYSESSSKENVISRYLSINKSQCARLFSVLDSKTRAWIMYIFLSSKGHSSVKIHIYNSSSTFRIVERKQEIYNRNRDIILPQTGHHRNWLKVIAMNEIIWMAISRNKITVDFSIDETYKSSLDDAKTLSFFVYRLTL